MASIKSVLKSKALTNLTAQGFKVVSTARQLENGTIALEKTISKKKKIVGKYAITASGAVLSNEFVARRVGNYNAGFKAVAELAEKRAAAI